MDSKIKIYYNSTINSCNKEISLILNEFHTSKHKNLILYRNNTSYNRDKICEKINILKLINLNYCNNCDRYADYLGFCLDHLDQKIIDQYISEYYEYINTYPEHSEYIENFLIEYQQTIKRYIRSCKNILECYDKNNIVSYDIQNNEYKQYINNIYDINYDKINIEFDKNIVIELLEEYNDIKIKKIDIIILIKFLHRKYNYDMYVYENIFRKNSPTKIFIGNNNKLYNHIFNSNIIYNIEFIDTEYPLKIDGHTLRFDIYMIIKVLDLDIPKYKYYKLVIETDENHHYCINNNNYDKLKDRYCIENDISLLRIDVTQNNNKLSKQDIEFCLFFIKYLIKIKKPIYYFSSKYIDAHQQQIKNININININDINDINDIDNIISFGSNNKNIININDIRNLDDIKNIDYYIKNHLTEIINKFTYKFDDDTDTDDTDD